jgi:hypothetical protein
MDGPFDQGPRVDNPAVNAHGEAWNELLWPFLGCLGHDLLNHPVDEFPVGTIRRGTALEDRLNRGRHCSRRNDNVELVAFAVVDIVHVCRHCSLRRHNARPFSGRPLDWLTTLKVLSSPLLVAANAACAGLRPLIDCMITRTGESRVECRLFKA